MERSADPEVARFIADYARQEPGSVLAVFARHRVLEGEEFDAVDAAVRFLEAGEESGDFVAEAVADGARVIHGDELLKAQLM